MVGGDILLLQPLGEQIALPGLFVELFQRLHLLLARVKLSVSRRMEESLHLPADL